MNEIKAMRVLAKIFSVPDICKKIQCSRSAVDNLTKTNNITRRSKSDKDFNIDDYQRELNILHDYIKERRKFNGSKELHEYKGKMLTKKELIKFATNGISPQCLNNRLKTMDAEKAITKSINGNKGPHKSIKSSGKYSHKVAPNVPNTIQINIAFGATSHFMKPVTHDYQQRFC